MPVDPDDREAFLHEYALEDLHRWAEKLSEPELAHARWFDLTAALLQTDVGCRLGVIGCSRLAARIVTNELIASL